MASDKRIGLVPGVYELWFKDKVYVGESKNVQSRAYEPRHLARVAHGEPDYIIFHFMQNSTKRDRILKENELMLSFGKEKCLNSMYMNRVSEKHKKSISLNNKGKVSHNKGKSMSEESNKKRSETLKGHTVSKETREKISKSLKLRKR